MLWMKLRHLSWVKRSFGPSGFLESRMATIPGGSQRPQRSSGLCRSCDWTCATRHGTSLGGDRPSRTSLRAEGGRGLAVVEAFSSRWGWHTTTMAGLAKVTWAEWRLPPAASEPPVSAEPDQALTPTSW